MKYALIYRDGKRFDDKLYTDLGEARQAWEYANCSFSDLNPPLLVELDAQVLILPDGTERPFVPSLTAPQAPYGQQAEPTDEQILDLAEKHLTPDFGDVLEFSRAVLALAGQQSERPAPAGLPPLTCKHSNRSDCALFGMDEPAPVKFQRPSREWYATKIQETLNDDFHAGSIPPQTDAELQALEIAHRISSERPAPADACALCGVRYGWHDHQCPNSETSPERPAPAGQAVGARIDAAADALSEVLAYVKLDRLEPKVSRALSGLRALQALASQAERPAVKEDKQ